MASSQLLQRYDRWWFYCHGFSCSLVVRNPGYPGRTLLTHATAFLWANQYCLRHISLAFLRILVYGMVQFFVWFVHRSPRFRHCPPTTNIAEDLKFFLNIMLSVVGGNGRGRGRISIEATGTRFDWKINTWIEGYRWMKVGVLQLRQLM